MGKFRLPDGAIIEIPGVTKASDAASKSQAPKPAAPRAKQRANGLPSQDELLRLARAEVAKQTDAAVSKALAQERREKITALEKQAADWRQKALDGRVAGLDPEIRALYVRKADVASAEAERLKSGTKDEDNPTARNHAAAAAEYRQRARAAATAESRRYFFDKAREFDARAELARNGRDR